MANIVSGIVNPLTEGLSAKNTSTAGGSQMQVTNQDDLFQRNRQVNTGITQLQDMGNLLSNARGVDKGLDVYNQSSALAQQLQQQAMGMGPNPVQAQLAQNTAANTANQAALMAGQRGVGQNAGMIARQASQMGANNQQQMVGQAATLQAQQQLAAQQQLQQQQAMMGSMANQFVGNELNAKQAMANSALQGQSNLLNAVTAQNQSQLEADRINSGIRGANTAAQNQLTGQLINAGSQIATKGGGGKGKGTEAQEMYAGGMIGGYAQGGEVKPHTKAGYSSDICHSLMMKGGGYVPGQAQVRGDSPKNDTVPAMLSPGEIVIPRSVLQDAKTAPNKAAAFVAAILAKNGKAS